MHRIALKIEYSGAKFCGSQFQPGLRTVQSELETALATYLRIETASQRVIFSGRTDTGVHARCQVVHFDVISPDVDLWRLCWAINGLVGRDLSVVAAQYVDNRFHARFTAIRRTYAYRILNRPQRSPLGDSAHHFIPVELNLTEMRKAAQLLVGSQDFAAFRNRNGDTTSTICSVESARMLNLGEGNLEFWISANHFVYNMVRIIVGTLLEIGLGKRPSTNLGLALTARQRQNAGPTAPPWGLCLESIDYPDEYALFKSAHHKEREQKSDQEIKP